MKTEQTIESDLKTDIDNYWLPLLKTDGQWDEQKIRNEMHDLVFIYEQISEVYGCITGGRLSKPMYYARVITDEVERRLTEALEPYETAINQTLAILRSGAEQWANELDWNSEGHSDPADGKIVHEYLQQFVQSPLAAADFAAARLERVLEGK
jgi:hypothetical protein